MRGFLAIVGGNIPIPDQLPPSLAQGVRATRAIRRRPWKGELPVGHTRTGNAFNDTLEAFIRTV